MDGESTTTSHVGGTQAGGIRPSHADPSWTLSRFTALVRRSAAGRLAAAPRPAPVYANLLVSGLLISIGIQFRNLSRKFSFGGAVNADDLTVSVAVIMLATLVILPGLIATLAVPTWLACRAAGGRASYRSTVTAAAWAAWLGAPIYALGLLLSGCLAWAGWSPDQVLRSGRWLELLGLGGAMWIWAQCVAEAHGFTRAWVLFGVPLVAVAVILFTSGGVF